MNENDTTHGIEMKMVLESNGGINKAYASLQKKRYEAICMY